MSLLCGTEHTIPVDVEGVVKQKEYAHQHIHVVSNLSEVNDLTERQGAGT
jgi:hypothetical protein